MNTNMDRFQPPKPHEEVPFWKEWLLGDPPEGVTSLPAEDSDEGVDDPEPGALHSRFLPRAGVFIVFELRPDRRTLHLASDGMFPGWRVPKGGKDMVFLPACQFQEIFPVVEHVWAVSSSESEAFRLAELRRSSK